MTDTELKARLERLERGNRGLTLLALVPLILAAALAGIYAAQPVPERITAHELDVVDSSGKVRARMDVKSGDPMLILYDGQGQVRVELGMGFRESGRTLRETNPGISFSDARGSELLGMGLSSGGSSWIILGDEQGYSMNLGATHTMNRTTGETQETSAASIVMFGNGRDHHVIWRAP